MDGETFNMIATVVIIVGALMAAVITLGVFMKLVAWLFR